MNGNKKYPDTPSLTVDPAACHKDVILLTSENPPFPVELGDMIISVSVFSANIVKDFAENLRNVFGGRLTHYEKMIEEAVNEAVNKLKNKAKEMGYDGVLGIKISNPYVVDGAVEVIVYGTGFVKKV